MDLSLFLTSLRPSIATVVDNRFWPHIKEPRLLSPPASPNLQGTHPIPSKKTSEDATNGVGVHRFPRYQKGDQGCFLLILPSHKENTGDIWEELKSLTGIFDERLGVVEDGARRQGGC
ncbi:hypothetical protein HPP92_026145 [Vanilla planifolia]|uniref:Uncharacterized protein n=1 Tax=Vanilla planifolia TaxID=51239 RepID=A0A835U7T9_VANPL|nr:hypothetical protein HPP92_026145 [Vanilla planifolia]